MGLRLPRVAGPIFRRAPIGTKLSRFVPQVMRSENIPLVSPIEVRRRRTELLLLVGVASHVSSVDGLVVAYCFADQAGKTPGWTIYTSGRLVLSWDGRKLQTHGGSHVARFVGLVLSPQSTVAAILGVLCLSLRVLQFRVLNQLKR